MVVVQENQEEFNPSLCHSREGGNLESRELKSKKLKVKSIDDKEINYGEIVINPSM